MKFLLDTHTFLWFIQDDPSLSHPAKAAIENSNNAIFISIVSVWEMAIKTSLGKLQLPNSFEEIIPAQILLNHFSILPITIPHLQQVAKMPFHHRDPFDRLLIAQCQVEECPIIGQDQIFSLYTVQQLW